MDRKQEGRELLDNVVKFLNVHDDDSRKIWNLLTALRGPDSKNDAVKHVTTSRLRGALGLRECSQFMVSYTPPIFDVGEYGYNYGGTRAAIDMRVSEIHDGQRESDHFLTHAAFGNDALAYFGFINDFGGVLEPKE